MADRFVNKDTIRAVYSDDLIKLLVGLGIDQDFEKGNIKCKYCDTIISRNNLFAISPEMDDVSFVCDSPECTEKMMMNASMDDEKTNSAYIDSTSDGDDSKQSKEDKR